MWGKQQIELLLTQYELHENLYNVRLQDYSNRKKRSKSLIEIAECLKKVDPGITVEAIKAKIHGLRGQYIKETRLIEESKRCAATPDEVYVPRLWFFPLMCFLHSHTYSRTPQNSDQNIKVEQTDDRSFESVDQDSNSNDSFYQSTTKQQPTLEFSNQKGKIEWLKDTTNYNWLSKQVIFEFNNITDQEIQRETAWKIQSILREANIDFRNKNLSSKMTSTVLCRTCGENIYNLNAKNLFDQENNELLENINDLTGIYLINDQQMPKHICACCESDLNHSVAFRERCIKTEKNLLDANQLKTSLDPLNTAESLVEISQIEQTPKISLQISRTHARPHHVSSAQNSTKFSHRIKQLDRRNKQRINTKTRTTHLAKSEVVFENSSQSHKLSLTSFMPKDKQTSKEANKTFICDQCGKSFAEASNLKLHLLRHTGVKNFECSECGRKYITLHLLNLHIRVRHKGEMPYACKYCEQRFYTSTSRCRHERVKHIKKHSYMCRLCGKTYTTKSYLNRHEFLHTGDRPHHCDVCDVAFPRKTNLKIHFRSKQHQKKAAEMMDNHDDIIEETNEADQIEFENDIIEEFVNV